MRVALAFLMTAVAFAQTLRFDADVKGEATAVLEIAAPGVDWAVVGHEASVATLVLDGSRTQHLMLPTAERQNYKIFLGEVAPGTHQVVVTSTTPISIANSNFKVIGTKHPLYSVVANMPVLYIRKDTVGKFSDIPLLAYCERLGEALQYTVIFSNEDGGTSSRALMARWGRSTDIEYIYRVEGGKAIVQGPNHQDLVYSGKREGAHPLLMPVTRNNMVGEASDSPLRFQLMPELVDLSRSSRESIMYSNPLSYRIAAKEMVRENQLRPFGKIDGEKISDQRNYLFIEYGARHRDSAFTVTAHLRSGRSFHSDLGRLDLAIPRNEWVQTTIELPPGTRSNDIESIEFRCQVAPRQPLPHDGECRLEGVNRLFQLDGTYLPGKSIWQMATPVSILAGQSVRFQL